MIGIDDFLVDGKSIGWPKDKQIRGIVDSGTSTLAGDRHIVDLIAHMVGPVNEMCTNLKDLPDVTVVIGGMNYVLKPEDYVLVISAEG